MMIIIQLLTYLFVFKNCKQLGGDARFSFIEIEDKVLISKFNENFQKKELLEYCLNDVNTINKIQKIIEFYNNDRGPNLLNGFLLDDWEF